MRGKVPDRRHRLGRRGITPAYAGKRDDALIDGLIHEDHPRMCGEKGSSSCSCFAMSGSPPHVRGKGTGCCPGTGCVGITPACAGKSAPGHPASCFPWDHPRTCGEKFTRKSAINCGSGSPPRVRGKGRADQKVQRGHRITPAHAGKRDARRTS